MPEDLTNVLDQAPNLTQGAWIVMGLMGLMLWLLGAWLIRSACIFSGLVLGAVLAGLVAGGLGGEMAILWVFLGAVAGMIAAWMLFRVWMGLSLALVLAALSMAVTLAWFSPGAWAPTLKAEKPSVKLALPANTQEQASIPQRVEQASREQYGRMKTAWDALNPALRRRAVVVAGIAAALGLLAGLLRPRLAASFQAALLGSVLMLLAAGQLIATHQPAWSRRLPHQGMALGVMLGLITLLGMALHWTLSRRRADKGSQQRG